MYMKKLYLCLYWLCCFITLTVCTESRDFDDIERAGNLIEEQTALIESQIKENGKNIDSPEADRLIEQRGRDVEDLADRMDEIVELRGSITGPRVVSGSRHSLLSGFPSNNKSNSIVSDQVEKQSRKVDQIGDLVEKIGERIENTNKRSLIRRTKIMQDASSRPFDYLVPRSLHRFDDIVRRSLPRHSNVNVQKSLRHVRSKKQLRKKTLNPRKGGLKHSKMHDISNVRSISNIRNLSNSGGIFNQFAESTVKARNNTTNEMKKFDHKRTLLEASSYPESDRQSGRETDRKVIVPVERKKLNKLMIFYYMKQNFPQFVHSIEKEIAKEELDNSADDFPVSQTSEQFLAKNEDKIKTMMADMLSDKENSLKITSGHISFPFHNFSQQLNISEKPSNLSSKSQAIEKQIEKKTGRDLINQTFEDDELADDELNGQSKENINCSPSDTRCIVKDLIGILKETYLKPKPEKVPDEISYASKSFYGEHEITQQDPYSGIDGFFNDNRGAEQNDNDAIASADKAGFSNFAAKNSFAGKDTTTTTTPDNLSYKNDAVVSKKIEDLVNSIQQAGNNGDSNKWRAYDVSKQLEVLKKQTKHPTNASLFKPITDTQNSTSMEANIGSKSQSHITDGKNSSSKSPDNIQVDVFDDAEITEKLKTLSNVITSLTSKQSSDTDLKNKSENLENSFKNVTEGASKFEEGDRKNTRLKYHSQKSTFKSHDNFEEQRVDHSHKKTPNKWRNYHPPPSNYADNEDADNDGNIIDGPDGKPVVHMFYTDHPEKSQGNDEKDVNIIPHDDDAVELFPDDIPDVTSRLLKARRPIISNLRNMNIVPREENNNAGYRSDRELDLIKRHELKRFADRMKRARIQKFYYQIKRADAPSFRSIKKVHNVRTVPRAVSNPYASIGKYPDMHVKIKNIDLHLAANTKHKADEKVSDGNDTTSHTLTNASIPDSDIYDFNGNIHPGVPHLQSQLPSDVIDFHKFQTEEVVKKLGFEGDDNLDKLDNQTVTTMKRITPSDDAIREVGSSVSKENTESKDNESNAVIDFSKGADPPLIGPIAEKLDEQDKTGERVIYMSKQNARSNCKPLPRVLVKHYLRNSSPLAKHLRYLSSHLGARYLCKNEDTGHKDSVHRKTSKKKSVASKTFAILKNKLASRKRRYLSDDDEDDVSDGEDVARLSYLTERIGHQITSDIEEGIDDVDDVSRSIVYKVNKGVKRVAEISDRVQAPLYDRYGRFYKEHDDNSDSDYNDSDFDDNDDTK